MTDRRKKRIFICLIGIDGSGKTTQAKALVRALKEKGVKSHYVWNRFEPRLMKPFIIVAKMLFFKGKDLGEKYTEYSETKKRLFKNHLLSTAYECLLLFDYLCRTQIEVRLPLILGRNIICDRYIQDTVASLAADMNYSPKKRRRVMRNLSFLVPKPELVLLIDVPEEVAYQRKNEFPLDLLMQRRMVYLDIAKENSIMIVDGNKSPAEMESLLQSMVARELNP